MTSWAGANLCVLVVRNISLRRKYIIQLFIIGGDKTVETWNGGKLEETE